MSRSARRCVLGGAAAALLLVPAAHAGTPSPDYTGPTASALGSALLTDPSLLAGAAFEEVPPGTPHAVESEALAGLPTRGASFTLLTTGSAALARGEDTSGGDGQALGGPSVRGDSDYDVTVLRLDLAPPATANCLRFDVRFASEEFPEYVGSAFNDVFLAEVGRSTWTTSGSRITAPDNIAFDPQGDPISINSSGVTSMSREQAAGTTYDGATPLLRVTAQVPAGDGNGSRPGRTSLYLSILDQGDAVLDSAALLDGLAFAAVPDPATQCRPGATTPTELTAPPAVATVRAPSATVHAPGLSARLVEGFDGTALAGRQVQFSTPHPLTGVVTPVCSATTGSDGVARCGALDASVAAVLGRSYTAVFAGEKDLAGAAVTAPLAVVQDRPLP